MYIVKKPLNLRGVRRKIGDVVDAQDVVQSRAYSLVRSGYLSEVGGGAADLMQGSAASLPPHSAQEEEFLINVPIIRKEGSISISASPEGISEVIRLLQSPVADTEQAIKEIEDDNVLILLDACDSRKTVKGAAKNRAMELRQRKETAGDEKEPERAGDA